jgi:hypothetical protein
MHSFRSDLPMSDSIFARRAFLFWLFFATLCLTRPALALEKYVAVPLPDERLGSKALAIALAGSGRYGVVGSQQKSDGTVGAVYWSIVVDPSDLSGNTVYSTELPKPPGWHATATGIGFLEGNPDRPLIVGYLQDGTLIEHAGIRYAVLWGRDASGQFTNTTLDDEAVQSQANAIATRNTPLGLIIVVCGKFRLPNGDWRACLWEIGPQGRRRIDLGTLGGRNSEAAALTYVDDLIGWSIVGSAQTPDGRSVATLWASNVVGSEHAWGSRALQTPPGAESRANSITHTWDGDLYIAGNVSEPNGRTTANIWINQREVPTALSVGNGFGDVLRRRNNTANGIIIIGQSGDDVLVVGSAWNMESDRTGLGVLSNGLDFQHPIIFDFDSLQFRGGDGALPVDTFSLNAVEPGGAIAGEGLCSGATTAQAVLLLPR